MASAERSSESSASGMQKWSQRGKSVARFITPPLSTIVACNTMHLALPSASVPQQVELVHLIEAAAASLNETVSRLDAAQNRPRKIVLWSTMATVAGGLYHKAVQAHGLALEAPPKEESM